MGCYHPMIRVEDTWNQEKAIDGHRYNKSRIISQEQLNDLEQTDTYFHVRYKKQLIPCRKCIGCRLDYSREWANRGYLESQMYPDDQVWFITLTYDNNHLMIPEYVETGEYIFDNMGDWKGILIPHDLELFLKNVRQKYPNMKKKYKHQEFPSELKIRYMACGEYGTEGQRPHYHVIMYGLKLPPEDLYQTKIINKNYYWRSHFIEECWVKREKNKITSRGISNVSQATWNNIAYTARYITKKINGDESDLYYASKGQIKEFFRMSRMPGIGELYYRKNRDKIYENDEVIIKNMEGIQHSKPPKYFDRLYEKEEPEKFEEIKRRRQQQSISQNRLKDMKTSLLRRERLEIEERAKVTQSKMLRRKLE